jgi:pyruvate carboxylase
VAREQQRLQLVSSHLARSLAYEIWPGGPRCAPCSTAGQVGLTKLLVANRGEIAVRICRAAHELGMATVAIFSVEDAQSMHSRVAGEAHQIEAAGGGGKIAAYLDIDAVIGAAKASGADSIHPGYGFLSENAEFAARCEAEGIVFVGPTAAAIRLFGGKTDARNFAGECGVPVIKGSSSALDSAAEMVAFAAAEGMRYPLMLKALHGGGGRGMRVVEEAAELAEAFERCSSEAEVAFGDGAVFVEEYLPTVRHIEVQVLGDGSGAAVHLYERDCSVQRRNQKVIEVAPARGMAAGLRARMTDAALTLARRSKYRGAGTVEFLLDGALDDVDARFFFLEMNPRLQVEHTITEAVTGVDIVQSMLLVCGGATLAELGLVQASVALRGHAVQARVVILPSPAYLITAYSEPAGPGIRVDANAYGGYDVPTVFDPLIAKVIAYSPSVDFSLVLRKMLAALDDFQIEGVETSLATVKAMLRHPDFEGNAVFTRFLADNPTLLVPGAGAAGVPSTVLALKQQAARTLQAAAGAVAPAAVGIAVDGADPLAVLELTASKPPKPDDTVWLAPSFGADGAVEDATGKVSVLAAQQGTVVSLAVGEVGAEVVEGQPLLIMNSMKMEHVVHAPASGRLLAVLVEPNATVKSGQPLATIQRGEVSVEEAQEKAVALDFIRPDLAEVETRRAYVEHATP